MSIKLKIKKDDNVIVITGKDKGKTGKVLKVFPKLSRVLVEGVNLAVHHTKQSATENGGLVSKPASIHISNVAMVDPKTGKATKVGYKEENGSKTRIAKRSGDVIDN